jgi:hypothetical protein
MNLKVRDEVMIAWKGRLIFKVYLPKSDRRVIKAYLLSESSSGSYFI